MPSLAILLWRWRKPLEKPSMTLHQVGIDRKI